MINVDKLKKKCFKKILDQCLKKMEIDAKTNITNTWFEIPVFMSGFPSYEIEYSAKYIIKRLSKNGFKIFFLNHNFLFINRGYPNSIYGWDREDVPYTNKSAEHNMTTYQPKYRSFKLLDHNLPIKENSKKTQIMSGLHNSTTTSLADLQQNYTNRDGVLGKSHKNIPGDQLPTVAYLFMTIGDIKQSDIWENYLVDKNIYVHAKHKEKVGSFKKYIIDEYIKTLWGDISLVKVMIALLRAALKNKNNQMFVFLSDSCIPIQPIETVETIILNNKNSFFNYSKMDGFFNIKTKENYMKYVDKTIIDRSNVYKSSQWCILNRVDALTIIRTADNYLAAFEIIGNKNAPDEIYMLTVLKQEAVNNNKEYTFTDRMTTWNKWISETHWAKPIQYLVEKKNNIPWNSKKKNPRDEKKYMKIKKKLVKMLEQAGKEGWSHKHPWEYTKFTDKDIIEIKKSNSLFLRKVSDDPIDISLFFSSHSLPDI